MTTNAPITPTTIPADWAEPEPDGDDTEPDAPWEDDHWHGFTDSDD